MITRRQALATLGMAMAIPRSALALTTVVEVPIRLTQGRVVLDVGLNGGPPMPFLLDTGGIVSLIRRDVAERSGLAKIGMLPLNSIGGFGGADAREGYRAREILIGNAARRSSVEFAAVDPDRIQLGASGSLNGEILTTYDSVLSFADLRWRIYVNGEPDRSGFTRAPSTIRQPAVRGAPFLYVDVQLDGQSLRLLVDTGAPRSIILQANAAKRLGLDAPDRPWAPWRARSGDVPGALGRATRADSLVVAGQTISRPIVNVRSNAPVTDLADGLLGLGMIQRFDWIVERRRGSLWVKPNGRAALADLYVRSGLGLDADRVGTIVRQVGFGSPAARAGLQVGDRLAGPLPARLTQETSGSSGAEVRVDVMRGSRLESVVVGLEDYL